MKMTTSSRLALLFTLALFAAGLVAPPARATPDDDLSVVAADMHRQLARISMIKSSIIAGRLEDVRKPASRLSDPDALAGLPADYKPYIADMKAYARQLAEAGDLGSAADSVARMANTCGNCHRRKGVDLEFGFDKIPRQDIEDIVTHMQRHQWAADQLWDGLIGPSNNAWNRGIDMLIDVPLEPSDVTTAHEHFDEINRVGRRIHELARTGTETGRPDVRSDMYGEILQLCAGCHQLLGHGPGH
ncbi:MAG: hypothetical protein ACE5EU_09495 [Paracoccaceae bacterium]